MAMGTHMWTSLCADSGYEVESVTLSPTPAGKRATLGTTVRLSSTDPQGCAHRIHRFIGSVTWAAQGCPQVYVMPKTTTHLGKGKLEEPGGSCCRGKVKGSR
jgi:hypothetical protein